jgi:hypothetical protein
MSAVSHFFIMYKKDDIVLIKSRAGDGIPAIHVKLIERVEVKPFKGTTIEWPGYVGWTCVLTKPEEADILRKKWSIPFKFPDNIDTFAFEEEIIKKVKNSPKKKRKKKEKK